MESDPDKYQVAQEKKPDMRSYNFKNDSFLIKVRKHFRSYCNHTSIHGFQYFGQNRTIVEKCWWIIIFMGIIGCCSVAIYLIYNKWQQSPVIVSLTTIDTPIYRIPFPAVTICPTIKFAKECINFSDHVDKRMNDEAYQPTPEQRKLFAYMIPVCKLGLVMDEDDLETIELQSASMESIIPNDLFETFWNCSPFMNNLQNTAKFMGEEIDFVNNFRPFLTEDGLCFTFNMLSTKHMFRDEVYFHPGFNASGPKSYWIPQLGYSVKAGLETYPRRALMSGIVNSLEIKLFHQKKDIDYKCTGAEQGYKVVLHHPTRIPSLLDYTMVQFSKASTISVKPDMMTTSKVVKAYAPDKRDCYFEGERKLQFFKIYSQRNCLFECETNYTLKKCDCVAFHMPIPDQTDRVTRLRSADGGNRAILSDSRIGESQGAASTPICGIPKLHCVNSARKRYNLNKLKSKLIDFQKAELAKKKDEEILLDLEDDETLLESLLELIDNETSSSDLFGATDGTTDAPRQKRSTIEEPTEDLRDDSAVCDCYRTCNELTYTGTVTVMEYDWREESDRGKYLNYTPYDFTLITVFLDTNTISTTERNELYGPTDFLSNFGGLIALFTGFSVLSLMEILYFCSLRIFGNHKLLGRWYGDKEE